MSPTSPDHEQAVRALLVRVLQDAHAGEWAAAYAYRGHWKSLRKRPDEMAEVQRIEGMEWHHRGGVRRMLKELDARPRIVRELTMGAIGRFFGALCFVSPHFPPMYAAGRLEAMNVGQYETARLAAVELGLTSFAEQLEAMRVEEDRHERWFGDQVRGHWLLFPTRLVFGWAPPRRPVS